MKHIKKIKLDVDKDVVNNIQAVQGDSGSRFIHASIQSNGQPINLKGTTVTIKGLKPSNKPIFNNCKIIDEENGVIEITLTNQMLAEVGAVPCQCKIIDGEGDLLSTKLFNIVVIPSIEVEEIESTKEFNALNEALGKVQNIDNKFGKVNEQLDNIVTKVEGFEEVINRLPTANIVEKNIVDGVLNLGNEMYQNCVMEDATEIVLPTVIEFTEIHLFFSATSDLTLILPNCKWQGQPSITANKDYEFIFTFTDKWLGGCIVYE